MNKTEWPWWLTRPILLKESDYWNIITISASKVSSNWRPKEIHSIPELPIELYQMILDCTNFLSRIRMRCANKVFHQKLEINDFYNIPSKYAKRLTDRILQSYPFITKLNAAEKLHITNVNYLTRLEILNASGYECGIESSSIKNLVSLTELNVANNRLIGNLNHMTNLEVLDIRRKCAVNDWGIETLTKLKFLNATNNNRISDVAHLTNLEVLHARGICDIRTDQIQNLTNLTKLIMFENTRITDLNRLTRLEVLDVGNGNDWFPGQWGCQLGDAGIAKLNLVKLKAQNNPLITNVNHMTRLKYLNAAKHDCGIDQNGISELTFGQLITKRNRKIRVKKLNK